MKKMATSDTASSNVPESNVDAPTTTLFGETSGGMGRKPSLRRARTHGTFVKCDRTDSTDCGSWSNKLASCSPRWDPSTTAPSTITARTRTVSTTTETGTDQPNSRQI